MEDRGQSLNISRMRATFFLPVIFSLACGGIYFSLHRFPAVENQVGQFTAPPEAAAHLTFGYSEIAADILWLRVVQDFGYCEARDGVKTRAQYEYAKTFTKDLKLKCDKSWVYQMVDRVTDLDPNFHEAYQFGGTMLSLLVDDKRGAQLIFAKGLRKYPKDWNMNYRAGYHQLFEMENKERAAQYFLKAAQNGAPPWLAQLSARLYTNSGKANIGKVILEEFAKSNPELAGSQRFKELQAKVETELHAAARQPANQPTGPSPSQSAGQSPNRAAPLQHQ